MDKVKFVDVITSIFLKAVSHKFYLVYSWILCPFYKLLPFFKCSRTNDCESGNVNRPYQNKKGNCKYQSIELSVQTKRMTSMTNMTNAVYHQHQYQFSITLFNYSTVSIISKNTRRSFLITLLIQESLLRTVVHYEWPLNLCRGVFKTLSNIYEFIAEIVNELSFLTISVIKTPS